MISAGNDVRVIAELKKMQLEYVYNALRNPKPEMVSKIRQLNNARQLSVDAYNKQKVALPYIVAGIFNPPYRKKENFAYTEYFIIDIDHISERECSLAEMRAKIQGDKRTMLCFVSPGGDGLKVFMKFTERCHDAGLYTAFYKKFVSKFSMQYGLDKVVDVKTSDVSRACFMSIDDEAYYNPNAELVDIKQYVNIDNSLEFQDTIHEIEKLDKEEKRKLAEKVKAAKEAGDQGISDNQLEYIKEVLSQKKPAPPVKNVFVPEILNEIINDLKLKIEEMGVEVKEIISIQYGKKIRMQLGRKQAEINLFHGHKGFSVVISPRTGTDVELNQVCASMIEMYVMQLAG